MPSASRAAQKEKCNKHTASASAVWADDLDCCEVFGLSAPASFLALIVWGSRLGCGSDLSEENDVAGGVAFGVSSESGGGGGSLVSPLVVENDCDSDLAVAPGLIWVGGDECEVLGVKVGLGWLGGTEFVDVVLPVERTPVASRS